MYPHSQEVLDRLIRDRIRNLQREARAAHLLTPWSPRPAWRARLAQRLERWALALDPELQTSRSRAGPGVQHV